MKSPGLKRPAPRSDASSEYSIVPLNDLPVGRVLRSPIHDATSANGMLLLAAGTRLTPTVIELLFKRGVTHVRVKMSDLSKPSVIAVQTPRRSGPAHPQQFPGWRDAADAFKNEFRRPQEPARSADHIQDFVESAAATQQQLNEVFERFERLQIVDIPRVTAVATEHLRLLASDFPLYVESAVQSVPVGAYSQHALQTAMLATSMGTVMGLRRDELTALCIGCLVHETGVLKAMQRLGGGDSGNIDSRLELMRHPIHSADAISRCKGVPHGAMMVAYQMHERMDGSGYPRARKSAQIHLLARVAAVADTYLTLTCDSAGQQLCPPYRAIESILHSTHRGQFESGATRALLHTISLFPVGSFVDLDDGSKGIVIEANDAEFTRPLVALNWRSAVPGSGRGINPADIVDLARQRDLSIVGTRPRDERRSRTELVTA